MTHSDMAKSLLALIQSPTLTIPANAARTYLELIEWLGAISDGHLLVINQGIHNEDATVSDPIPTPILRGA